MHPRQPQQRFFLSAEPSWADKCSSAPHPRARARDTALFTASKSEDVGAVRPRHFPGARSQVRGSPVAVGTGFTQSGSGHSLQSRRGRRSHPASVDERLPCWERQPRAPALHPPSPRQGLGPDLAAPWAPTSPLTATTQHLRAHTIPQSQAEGTGAAAAQT